MSKDYKHTLSAISLFSAGLILSGCIWNDGAAPAPEPAKEPSIATQPQVKSVPQDENQELAFAKDLITHKDCVRAFQILTKYAAEGNAEAEAWLGRCYMNGIGTERDFDKAHEFFAKAAEKNNPWGINGVGVCMQYGFGTAVNLQTAMEHFKRAADLKHPLGTLNLARTYADKEGGFLDAKLAEEYFRKAVELDAPSARSHFAAFLYDQSRYKEAVDLLRGGPIDDPLAMEMMAKCYQNGWGMPVDTDKAAELAEKHFQKTGPARWSADLCFEAALEEILTNGLTDRAKRYLKCSADQGNAEAQYLYAKILAEAKDNNAALSYMLKSADGGYYAAMVDAGEMLVERKDYDRAVKYYMLASRNIKTQDSAVGNLSNIYHYNLKMPKTGFFWDVRGAQLGLDVCRNELAVKELFTKGDEHFAKAAALFAEGKISENKFAMKWLDDILTNDYERLRTLADKNNSDALLALGIIGCLEKPGHPNISIGIALLEKSAKLNNATACRILGNLYRNGGLAKKDLKKALSWYQQGAELGDAESARTAALMVFYEDEFKDTKIEDFKKIFDKALELEVFSVAFEYGRVMELLAKDLKRAEELYRIAAAHEDGRAMLRLHDMLFKTNEKESFDFLWRAVKAESSEAELRMGDIQKIWKNPRAAFIYYVKANLHGDEVNAPYKMAECLLTGYGCEINLDCFWKNAKEAYDKGCVEVCYLLGSVYRDGKICARDMAKAKAYFEEGVKRGSENCKKALMDL